MNNQNNAKKIIEVDLSNKWPVGSVIVTKSGTSRHRSSAIILSYLGNDTVSVSHASGRPTTMQTKTMQTKYRLATAAESSIFSDAAIGPDKDSAMDESKNAVPRGPRKVEAAPVVEPDPQPTPTPAPAAPATDAPMVKVDTSVIELIFKKNAEDRDHERRWFAEEMERRDAKIMGVLEKFVSTQHAAQSTAPPTKEQVKRGENAKVIKAELSWARPLVEEFVAAELEMVTFNTAAEIERAMFPGDVQQALELWCLANGKQAPDNRTTNVILKEIAPERRFVSDGKTRGDGDKQKTQFARRRQTTFDFEPSANDVDRVANDVIAHGRKVLWPDLPAGDQSAIRVAGLLKGGKVTKAELIAAINGARIERDRLPVVAQRQITPLTVFADAARVRYLGKTFRDLGGGK